jgi:mannose-6-phosphate isomerase-like protein (cupin superfamily)
MTGVSAVRPVLLRPGEGEQVSDNVRIKADSERLVVTESHYPPGESGPGPHVHREHADCFYVLEGELEFGLGDETARLGPGGFVAVPPGIVHTFRNPGPGEARFVNVHAPGKGFADHLRAMRDGEDAGSDDFDTFDPPDDGGRPPGDAVVHAAGEGERLDFGAAQTTVKAGADDIGFLSLTENRLDAGFPGPPPHVHETFADSFWVLEGVLTLRLGEQAVEAGPGTFALAPPGTVHTFSNPGDEPAREMNLTVPGGFERYLRELSSALRGGAEPDPETIAAIASRYDFRPVQ